MQWKKVPASQPSRCLIPVRTPGYHHKAKGLNQCNKPSKMKKTFTIAVTSLLFFSQNRVDAQLISSGLNHSVFVCSSPGTPVLLGRDDQVSSLTAITAVSAGH